MPMLKPIKLKKLEIHPATLLLLFFALLFDFIQYLLIVYAIVLIHELAHACCAFFLGVKLSKLEVLPFGITIHISNAYIKKPLHEIIIAAAGPICSGALAFLCRKLDLDPFLVTANAAVALLNFIPALPLDGGRIARAFLTEKWGYIKSFNFMLKVTKVFAVSLALAGVMIVFYTRFNFSLLLIGAFLIVNTIKEQQICRSIIMNEILRSRQKLSNGCAERVAYIAISADEPARKALKLLSYNRYYLISVIDSDMNIIGTITETKLIEQLAQKGIRTKASKIVDLT
jgi:stage IV sporulation protein FB